MPKATVEAEDSKVEHLDHHRRAKSTNSTRVPPHNFEAEEAVLGALLIAKGQKLPSPVDQLRVEDFHSPAHRAVFRAIEQIREAGEMVDVVTVYHLLREDQELADIGGASALHDLEASVATVSNAGRHAELVLGLSSRRKVIDLGAKLAQSAYEDGGDSRFHEYVAKMADEARVLAEPPQSVAETLLASVRTGAWLTNQTFGELVYMIPGLQPEGLTLLVGAPKIGKSWKVLGHALAIASGGTTLSAIPVGKARPVLYLALEDSDRRMQARCRKLLPPGATIPAEFQYATRVEPVKLFDTCTAWFERHAGEHGLIIIDTLGKVMPPALIGETGYQRDYRIGSDLKKLCDDDPGSGVLVNHHDRKANSEDFVDAVSGTNGLAGAADTIMVLSRPRTQTTGLLQITGRDVPEAEYALAFEDGYRWVLAGANLAEAADEARQVATTAGLGDRSIEIVRYVMGHPEGVTPAQVAAKMSIDSKQASQYLRRAVEGNRLDQLGRGKYGPLRPSLLGAAEE